MDWENERYVRVYTRDTGDLLAVGWQGRAVLWELMRKVDRAGVLDEADPEVLAELLRMPAEVVESGLEKLSKRGVLELVDGCVVLPNFLEAQEAKASEKQRQRESRARRLEKARLGKLRNDVTKRDTASQNVTDCHDSSHGVTGGHTVSHPVTPSLAVPSQPSLDTCAPTDARPTRSEVTQGDLDAIYRAYPRKKGKAPGMKAAKTKVRTREDFERLCECVRAMATAWAGKDLDYCPYWSTFVQQERWRDEEWPLPEGSPQPGVPRLGDFEECDVEPEPALLEFMQQEWGA